MGDATRATRKKGDGIPVLSLAVTEDGSKLEEDVSPLSQELVIGFVGYAGAGCSAAASRLEILLQEAGYDVEIIKLSGAEIITRRGKNSPGTRKLAFILDSLKHSAEVDLLRKVYDVSFRLIAVHCERPTRERRLLGTPRSAAKYAGVPEKDVLAYMDRDEKDQGRKHGQQVRDAFYLADFFVDNNITSQGGENLNVDLSRFVDLLLGSGLVRPTKGERAMYHAHAAALQSSCLSRQVGAALVAQDGTIVSTGTNDVPKFGGGVYDEDSENDCRCFAWEFVAGDLKYLGCHNDRKKDKLRQDIQGFLTDSLSSGLALAAHPVPQSGSDTAERARQEAEKRIREFFGSSLFQMGELASTSPAMR